MTRKVAYWASTGLLAGLATLPPSPTCPAVPKPFKDSHMSDIPNSCALFSESPSRLERSPFSSRLSQNQRVGLCRLQVRVDLGLCRALPRKRWPESLHAARTAPAPLGFLLHAPRKPPDKARTRRLLLAKRGPMVRISRGGGGAKRRPRGVGFSVNPLFETGQPHPRQVVDPLQRLAMLPPPGCDAPLCTKPERTAPTG